MREDQLSQVVHDSVKELGSCGHVYSGTIRDAIQSNAAKYGLEFADTQFEEAVTKVNEALMVLFGLNESSAKESEPPTQPRSVDELRKRLMAEIPNMTEEQMRAELEEAGYVIRDDLPGSGILNPDGSVLRREKD